MPPVLGGIRPEFPSPFHCGPARGIELRVFSAPPRLRGEYETSSLVPASSYQGAVVNGFERRHTVNSTAGYSIASMAFALTARYVMNKPDGRRTQSIPRVTPGQSTGAARRYYL
jgi:hypothetical protein